MGIGLKKTFVFAPLMALAFLLACDGPGSAGPELGRDVLAGPAAIVPRDIDIRSGTSDGDSTPVIGSSCRTEDPGKLCLALKYVVYRDPNANAILNELETLSNVGRINQLWSQCNIGFQVEQFVAASPADHGLKFQTANTLELDEIRSAFADDRSLLLVTTGTWDRTGTLGNTGANAWTAMPGGPPYGAILEKPVATYSNIIAHELGHYLNLLHASDTASLMNPIIYKSSTKISASDCSKARSAAKYFWSKMLR